MEKGLPLTLVLVIFRFLHERREVVYYMGGIPQAVW